MPSERYPNVAVAADQQPRDAPFRLGVEKGRDFSPDAPARIRVTFENRSSTEQTVGFGPIPPFSEIWSEGDGLLVLVPSDAAVRRHALGTDEEILPDRPVDGCWQTNPVRFVRHDVLRWRTLDAGERVRTEYAVLRHPEREILAATTDEWVSVRSESDGCLPAGEYRFEESFPPDPRTDAAWDEFEWGFSLDIEE
ncbi:hypothetical protein [Halopelagius longus]|uniref:Uncharacterized protein n=1 Tax=Halopelagius longus TaxID=1236180 RepID=A0A1H1B458_9EURY|nr:hypothetical protein [Halopelagius longus]RDI70633.1 hypothetical protein DWB78_02225 [Halopelagius longus]SDQ46704.1 hypothetical protein SAMN05216278_1628 [Halopelagius longus]